MSETLASKCKYRRKSLPLMFESWQAQVQEYVSDSLHSAIAAGDIIRDRNTRETVKNHIRFFVEKQRYTCKELDTNELADKLYYGLTYDVMYEPLFLDDNVEKINCNSWDTIFVTFTDGSKCRINGFPNKERAEDVVRKMFADSSVSIDHSHPVRESELIENVRVAASMSPVIKTSDGVAFSVRKLNPHGFAREEYIANEFIAPDAFDFLVNCLCYGTPVAVVGKVGTGKTMFISALLKQSADKSGKRIFVIESGAREIVLGDSTDLENPYDVVYTMARPTSVQKDEQQSNVTQESLLKLALRSDPDIITVSEMRDIEAYAAQEATNTGSTVITSLHAAGAQEAHERIADLCRKAQHTDYKTAIAKASRAFPITVFLFQGVDYKRRCVSITEAVTKGDDVQYNQLFGFEVIENLELPDGSIQVIGEHKIYNTPSDRLKQTMVSYGAPRSVMNTMSPIKPITIDSSGKVGGY